MPIVPWPQCESAEGQGWTSYATTSTGSWNYYTTSATTNLWSPWTSNGTLTNSTVLRWEGELVIPDWGRASIQMMAPTEYHDLDHEQREAEIALRRQERVTADHRGEELLLSLLDDNQREAYRLDGTFMIIGSCGTVYRIHRGTAGNIEWVKPDGEVGGRLCAHPTMREHRLPTPDVMLAQALALMTDEREFVRIANVHQGVRPVLV